MSIRRVLPRWAVPLLLFLVEIDVAGYHSQPEYSAFGRFHAPGLQDAYTFVLEYLELAKHVISRLRMACSTKYHQFRTSRPYANSSIKRTYSAPNSVISIQW